MLPVFKISPLLIFGMLAVWKDKATRVFYCYGALIFLITGLFENMAFTSEYGFAALIGNMAICLIIAATWLRPALPDNLVSRSDILYDASGLSVCHAFVLSFRKRCR